MYSERGHGKTYQALMRAKYLSADGHTVALCCFNKEAVETKAQELNVDMSNIHLYSFNEIYYKHGFRLMEDFIVIDEIELMIQKFLNNKGKIDFITASFE